MKVGIIQSSYIPWRGYFDFIDDADLFIYLDDAQYSKGTWRNRNKIKTANGTLWLTVPVSFRLSAEACKIEDIKIDYAKNWAEKHIKTLTQSYSKAPFFRPGAEELFDLLRRRYESISQLNTTLNAWIMRQLHITTETRMSAELQATGLKTDRLIDLLAKVGATTYISGPSARDYLDIKKFREAGIGLEFKSYEYPEYPQLHGPFEAHVSVLDLLFNCGPQARNFLKSTAENEKVI